MEREMNLRHWIVAAFLFAMFMSICALWAADNIRAKGQAVENSMTGIKVALTPFERDKALAVDKVKQAGIDPRWVEGGK